MDQIYKYTTIQICAFYNNIWARTESSLSLFWQISPKSTQKKISHRRRWAFLFLWHWWFSIQSVDREHSLEFDVFIFGLKSAISLIHNKFNNRIFITFNSSTHICKNKIKLLRKLYSQCIQSTLIFLLFFLFFLQ